LKIWKAKNKLILRFGEFEIVDVGVLPSKKNFYTKAGQISFSGYVDGRKVKIYSTFNENQARLRNYIGSLSSSNVSLPEVLFIYKNIVCEEWIHGIHVSKNMVTDQIEGQILNFIHLLENLPVPQKYIEDNFCYIENYLLKRFDVWKNFEFAQNHINKIENLLKSKSNVLEKKLNHPDITPRNLIYEKNRDKFFLIDNELLGFGFGWMVSRVNFFHSINKHPDFLSDNDFTKVLWETRVLISELESKSFGIEKFRSYL
jgi:hypothetical protein